jgi:spore maturation protein CgeB
MDILIYGKPGEMALGKMCERGFEKLLHNVEYFPNDPQSAPLVGPININSVNQEFADYVIKEDPNLVLVMKGYNLSCTTLERIQSHSTATVVNWNPDNPFQVRSEKKEATTYLDALPAYDTVFTWSRFLKRRLKSRGAKKVAYLPFGWDSTLHQPMDPDQRFDCEVMFLGIWSSKRQRHLSALTDFDFHLRGNYWKLRCWDFSLRRCHRGGKLDGRDYARAMSSADIVVNVVADHNLPDHNMRTFEVPATGSMLVTTRTTGQQRFFEDEQEIVMYDDPDELKEKVGYYIENNQERESIAERGYEAVQEHSYVARMQELLEKVFNP